MLSLELYEPTNGKPVNTEYESALGLTAPGTLVTSVIFGALHTLTGKDGLLWIAAIDTFALSLVLCYLREKTGNLYASMGVHAIKNGIAFLALFVLHLS